MCSVSYSFGSGFDYRRGRRWAEQAEEVTCVERSRARVVGHNGDRSSACWGLELTPGA